MRSGLREMVSEGDHQSKVSRENKYWSERAGTQGIEFAENARTRKTGDSSAVATHLRKFS